jgi:type I restriction enzyme, S subunit
MNSPRVDTIRRKIPLGEVCDLVNGKAYNENDWRTSGIPIIRIQNLNSTSKPFNYWDGEIDRQVIVNDGDVLLAWSGTPGTSFGAHLWDRGLAVLNQHIFRVDFDRNQIDPEWIVFAINEQLGQMIGKAHGAVGLRHVTRKECDRMMVSLPDFTTQCRLANELKGQMAQVAEAKRALKDQQEAVEPLFEKFLVEAFRGIIPLSLGINADPAPHGWEWHRLLHLARLESGHTPSRKHPEYWENGHIPWLALPDIRALDCQIAMETSERTNDLGIANSSARLLPADTVALSRTASVGFVTLFGRPMATSQDFVNWISGEEIHPKFLMWLLRASRKFIREVSTGAIHKTVYMDVVERFHVCLPSLGEQKAIAQRLDELFSLTESLRNELEEQQQAVLALPAAYLRETFAEHS